MRIGIEAQRIFRPKKHGMDIVALEFIKAMMNVDKQNDYFVFVKPDEDKCLNSEANFKVIELPGKTYIDWEQISLPKAVKKYDIDILHCTSNTAPFNPRVPLVLLLHDVIYLEKNPLFQSSSTWYQKLGNLYRKWNVPGAVKRSEKITTVSNYEKKNISFHFPEARDKLSTNYNAVGEHFYRIVDEIENSRVKAAYNLPDEFLLFFGNTDPKKNTRNTLLGYLEYLKENPNGYPIVLLDIKLDVLVDMVPELKSVSDKLIIPGYVNNKDLPTVYNCAKVFLYTSLRESFGIPLLEAMASGVPVVAAKTSSLPEIAEDAALFVQPQKPNEIANAISKVLSDDNLRESMIQKGRDRASAFSWETTARYFLEIFTEVYDKKIGQRV